MGPRLAISVPCLAIVGRINPPSAPIDDVVAYQPLFALGLGINPLSADRASVALGY